LFYNYGKKSGFYSGILLDFEAELGFLLKVTGLLDRYTYFIPNGILLNLLLPLFKKLIKKHQNLI